MNRISRSGRACDPPARSDADGFSAPLRIAVGLTAVIVAFRLGRYCARTWVGSPDEALSAATASAGLAIVAAIGAYWAHVRVTEGRFARELAFDRTFAHAGTGFALSVAAITLTYGILWLVGVYRAHEPNPLEAALPVLLAAAATATVEEIIFRGVIFRALEQALGLAPAFVLGIAIFGLAHLFNTAGSLLNSAAMALAAGVPFTVAYLLTRNLWLCIGMHAGWNFAQLGIFGDSHWRSNEAWLAGTLEGPVWLTGGRFGLEGSVVLVLVGLALGGGLHGWGRLKQRRASVLSALAARLATPAAGTAALQKR